MEKVRLINQNERKLLTYIFILTLTFSLWFYLVLSSKDRFVLAHGYGLIPEAKELLGILGIALAFIASFTYYHAKKAKGFLLITTGLGLILIRSIIHSSHMLNAMEQNSSLFEAIFEGENHVLLSVFDVGGALFLSIGLIILFEMKNQTRLLTSIVSVEAVLLVAILVSTGGDFMMILNNMIVSHGIALVPILIAVMPVVAFLYLGKLSYDSCQSNPSEFKRLFFIGAGLILLRTVVHGVHTVFGVETHFFQSGFDGLGGIVIASAFYKAEETTGIFRSARAWTASTLLLLMAAVYSIFTFFKFK